MASAKDKADLRQKVKQLLEESKERVIFNSFWGLYKQRYDNLPNPQTFKVNKRSELFQFCEEICEVETYKGKKFVILKKGLPSSDKKQAASAKKGDKKKEKSKSPAEGNGAIEVLYNRLEEVRVSDSPASKAQNTVSMAGRSRSVYDTFYEEDQRGFSRATHRLPHSSRDNSGHRNAEPSRNFNQNRDRSNSGRSSESPSGASARGQFGTPQGKHQQSADELLNFHYPALGAQPVTRSSPFPQQQQYRSRPRMQVAKEEVNSVAEDCIDRISEAKEFVSLERIEKLILQHYNIESLDNLGIRKVENISCVNEHLRKMCKVNAYIQAFVKVRSIATVHELHESMKDFVTEKNDFETLKVGPFIKLPLVYEFFKVPQDKEILEITTADLMEHLRCYLTEKELWTSRGVQVEQFMEFLVEKYAVESPYELGVRLRSMPLTMQVGN